MVTLREIAEVAGVSHVTVSKALTGASQPTRAAAKKRVERIRRIAREMGYRPNTAARSLRSGRTGMIAVLGETPLTLDEQNQEEYLALRQIASRLRERGLTLSTQLCEPDDSNDRLPPWSVDAAIVVSPNTPQHVAGVEDVAMPYVVLNGVCGPGGSAVQYDDDAGIRLAVDTLVEAGHERIAYLNHVRAFEHPSVDARFVGYHARMGEHGLPPLPTGKPGEVDREAIAPHLRTLRDEHGCTAVICWDPWVALFTYQAAEKLGLAIPDDLSVLTFNDTAIGAEALRPPTTVIARPIEATAAAVVALLHEQLESPRRPVRTVTLPPRVIRRGSVAPPTPTPKP